MEESRVVERREEDEDEDIANADLLNIGKLRIGYVAIDVDGKIMLVKILFVLLERTPRQER